MGSWAWEFVRRNKHYSAEHEAHRNGALERSFLTCGMEVLKLSRPEPNAARFGLSFFVSPRKTCLQAPVFWDETVNSRVATIEAKSVDKPSPNLCLDGHFNLSKLPCSRALFVDHDGYEQLRLVYGKRTIQLRCEGVSLLSGDVDLSFILRFFGPVDAKIETLKRLKSLYDGHLPELPTGHAWTSTALNLRDALIALDVFLLGGSHRDTAKIIYGETGGSERYRDPNESTRNRMRRLRKKGVNLMTEGYLDLMKQRGSIRAEP